jgi:hypothetical protein
VVLVLVLALGALTGCDFLSAGFTLEPFDLEWGLTEAEVNDLLECVYLTNAKSEHTFYVMGSQNEDLQAFGTTPKVIIYNFTLVKQGSEERRLGEVTISFPSEDYEKVLAYLEGKLGESKFDVNQWGTVNTNIYLFKKGILQIEYSNDPIVDPAKVAEETRDRYVALNGITFSSKEKSASLTLDQFNMLWRYSSAETDFVKVDNTK